MKPLLVVDAANVVGAVPDGWWRDRAGAATRLRDSLVAVAERGIADGPEWLRGPLEVVLVVEGAARSVPSVPNVRVVPASGSGDDAIVQVTAGDGVGRTTTVVTADRGLRDRVRPLGATVLGPRSLPYAARNPGTTG